jgi:hypothetical protein
MKKTMLPVFNDHQRALKNAAGILANQNTISTILKMLIPVKRPRVPPVFKKEKNILLPSQIIDMCI